MKEETLVTVVIPVYNVENYVDQCLESVINQTYQQIEILVMEARSTDRSLFRVIQRSRQDDRVIIVSRKDGGLGPARNYALQMAQGEFVVFLDSDDWIEKDYIQNMMAAVQSKDIDLVMADFIIHNEETGKEQYCKSGWEDGIYESIYDKRRFMCYGNPSMWGKLFRKELFLKYGIGQPALPFEDLAVYPALIAASRKIAICSSAVIHYRMAREGSLLANKESYCKFSEVMQWAEKSLLDTGCYAVYRKAFQLTMYYHFRKIGSRCILLDNYEYVMDQELKKEYLQIQFKNLIGIEKTTYWAIGSFPLRWIIHRLENGKERLLEHFTFTGLIAQMCDKEVNHPIYHKDYFRQECINTDIKRKMKKKLSRKTGQPDYVVIDFIQECQDIYEIEENIYITDTDAFQESDFSGTVLNKIHWHEAAFWKLWRESCGRFAGILSQTFDVNRIILMKNKFAATYLENGTEKYYGTEIKMRNELLEKMYSFFLEQMPGVRYLELPQELLYTDMTGQNYTNEPCYLNAKAYNYMAQRMETGIYAD